MRILVIDDEPGVTKLLVTYLEDEFHTVKVLNLVRPREIFKELLGKFKPDGVSLDFDMSPSGDVIYRWIREWSSSAPIVFYTKYANSPAQRQRMIQAGARGEHILHKQEASADVEILLDKLRNF